MSFMTEPTQIRRGSPSSITPGRGAFSYSAARGQAALRLAVLIPCCNEAATIARVVMAFRQALPEACVYVYDNASTDATAQAAAVAGARVRREAQRGKGRVVGRMFADVDADVYLMVDGDDTYDAGSAPRLIRRLLDDQLDMVCGSREAETGGVYPAGHRLGNRLLTTTVSTLFQGNLRDMLTGYRVMSRRFVKTFPALSSGFEIETQLTVHALSMRIPFAEESTVYRPRPAESESKLHTLRDGWRILRTILYLVKDEKPLGFFFLLFLALATASLGLAWPVIMEFMATGLVPRFPTAILATGMMLLGFLSLASGLILDTVNNGRRELKRLHFLAHSVPRWANDSHGGSGWTSA